MQILEPTVTYYDDTSFAVVKNNYLKTTSDLSLHSHDHLLISLLLSGSIIEHTSNYTTVANSSSVFIKPPGTNHSNIFPADTSTLSIKVYDWDYYQLDFDKINIFQGGAALPQFLNILSATNKKQAFKELKESLSAHIRFKKSRKIPAWLAKAKGLIERHFNEPVSITRLAKEIGKHPGHLSRTFKLCFGVDIKLYQKQIRLHHAISDISAHGKNLTRIAQDCGFYDQSHFSRDFKKITKMPPTSVVKLLNV